MIFTISHQLLYRYDADILSIYPNPNINHVHRTINLGRLGDQCWSNCSVEDLALDSTEPRLEFSVIFNHPGPSPASVS